MERLKRLTAVQLWLLSIVISVVMAEFIVGGMEILLKGEITYDYLLTGFVTSLFVAGLVVGILSFFITRLRKSEAALQETQTFLQQVVDASPSMIFIVNGQGRLLFVNRYTAQYYGATPEQLMAKSTEEIHGRQSEAQRFVSDDREVARTRQRIVREELNTAPNGEQHWFHTVKVPLLMQDGTVNVLGISTDITERKEMELSLIAAKDEAERANRAKSKFLSSMSHELRTPLNAVLGFGQLLEMDATLNAQQHDEVSEIIKAGQHLLEMITEVLDLSRVESGNIQLSIEPVNFGELAGMCLTLIQPLAQKRGIRLAHDHVAEVVVRADSTRLKQILINLLSNAVKYNRDGGQIRLHTAPAQGDAVRIMVTDSGFGIPPERMAELFQPFNRLGAEGGTIEGTGIGLTISKRLVELMGGRIGVESEAGVGSTFWVELPRAILEAAPAHAKRLRGQIPP